MSNMTKEKAQQMLKEGIAAMLEVGEMKHAEFTAFRGVVLGKTESAACLLFADSKEVITALSARLTTTPKGEAHERFNMDLLNQDIG